MAIDPCTTATPPQRGVVRFVAADFKAAYPEFATVADGLLARYFGHATLLLGNGCGSMICDAATRETLLYMLTAHIAQLFSGVNGQAPTGAVGRITSATEGSTSATMEFPSTPDASWYNQTPFGAMYWNATARWRTFVYVAPPADVLPPWLDPSQGCGC